MKSYGMDDAKVIIRDFGEDWVEFKSDGVHLSGELFQYDTSQVLHWKYACELDDSNSPNPLTAPNLPFPFTASELAAFMLDGVGAAIASNYGNWEDGPDQEMLDSMGVLAREPKRAITDAYSAFMVAQATVGSYPVELQKRADRLCKIYSYRNDKANTREGVFAQGIGRDEANARRARAVASNAQLEKLYQIATKEYQAASCFWRKAMVNELLKPTSEQAATRAPATGAATPAPVVTVSDVPTPLKTGDIAHCFDGLRWDEQGWKDTLGSDRKWLIDCLVTAGQRGVNERRWNPVLIGAWLVHQGHVSTRKVRAKFQTVDLLKPWFDAWKTYEADNFDTQ